MLLSGDLIRAEQLLILGTEQGHYATATCPGRA
jgi:hypothetical protein